MLESAAQAVDVGWHFITAIAGSGNDLQPSTGIGGKAVTVNCDGKRPVIRVLLGNAGNDCSSSSNRVRIVHRRVMGANLFAKWLHD